MLETKLRDLGITAADREVAMLLLETSSVEQQLQITQAKVRQSLSNLYIALNLSTQNISTLVAKLNQLKAEY